MELKTTYSCNGIEDIDMRGIEGTALQSAGKDDLIFPFVRISTLDIQQRLYSQRKCKSLPKRTTRISSSKSYTLIPTSRPSFSQTNDRIAIFGSRASMHRPEDMKVSKRETLSQTDVALTAAKKEPLSHLENGESQAPVFLSMKRIIHLLL